MTAPPDEWAVSQGQGQGWGQGQDLGPKVLYEKMQAEKWDTSRLALLAADIAVVVPSLSMEGILCLFGDSE